MSGPLPDDRLYLQHILDAISRIESHVSGVDRSTRNALSCRAIVEGAVNETFRRLGEQRPPKFAERVDLATKKAWISAGIADIAKYIWKRGSDFAHPMGDHMANMDALPFIRQSILVVKALNAAQ